MFRIFFRDKINSRSSRLCDQIIQNKQQRQEHQNTNKWYSNSIMNSPVVLKSAVFTDIYEVSKELGSGKSGVVKLCKHRQSGVEFAGKFLNRETESGTNVKREIEMHNITNSHPSFLQLVEAYDTLEDFVLVTEFMKGGDLIGYVMRGEEWNETYTIKVIRELLKGLAMLHSKSIGHFDMKLDNILLTGPMPHGQPKICDLGLMRDLSNGKELREMIGTIHYIAPEVLAYEPLSTACDMWSVGVITYGLLVYRLPFSDETSEQITMMNIIKAKSIFPKSWFKSVSPEAIDFMKKLLLKEPKSRMTAEEALNHPWLKVKDQIELPFNEGSEIARVQQEIATQIQCDAGIQELNLPCSSGNPVILDKCLDETAVEESNDSGISSLDFEISDSEAFEVENMENIPQKAMENIPQKAMENIPQKAMENIPQKAMENIPQKAMENIPQKAMENIPQKAMENIPQKAMENVNDNVTSLMKKGSSLSISQPVFKDENFNSAYVPLSELYLGNLSDVKKYWKNNTGKEYAVKFTSKNKGVKLAKQRAWNEIQMLQMTNGLPHVISLFEIYETESDYILVNELMRGGDLFNYIEREKKLDERSAVRVMRQVIQGLASLHKLNIVHLNICPENILCSISLGIIKICDFGVARVVKKEEALCEMVGTLDYAAPEVLAFEPLSTACDMWSVGALTYTLLTGCTPFSGCNNCETTSNVMEVNLEFPDDIFQSVSSVAIDFIKKLLVKDPEQRLTAEKCLEHPWMKA